MDRRDFFRRAIIFGTALAVGAAIPKAEAASLPELIRSVKTPRTEAAANREVDFFMNNVFPQFIIADYERRIHSSKSNAEKYKYHIHPAGEPDSYGYWNEKFHNISTEVLKFDEKLGLGLHDTHGKAVERMNELGYVYYCLPSAVGGDAISYFFGKISDEKIVNSSGKKIRVICYENSVPPFEDYVHLFKIFGRSDIDNGKVSIDRKAINANARYVFELGKKLKQGFSTPFGSFYDAMILKECRHGKSAPDIAKLLEKAVVAHEINHINLADETSIKAEISSQLVQLYHEPYLTLAMLQQSSISDSTADQEYNVVAKEIFRKFERLGYSKEDLAKLSERKIKYIVRGLVNNI